MFITLNANFITVHLSNFLVSCQSLKGKFVRVFSLNCSVDHQCNPLIQHIAQAEGYLTYQKQ